MESKDENREVKELDLLVDITYQNICFLQFFDNSLINYNQILSMKIEDNALTNIFVSQNKNNLEEYLKFKKNNYISYNGKIERIFNFAKNKNINLSIELNCLEIHKMLDETLLIPLINKSKILLNSKNNLTSFLRLMSPYLIQNFVFSSDKYIKLKQIILSQKEKEINKYKNLEEINNNISQPNINQPKHIEIIKLNKTIQLLHTSIKEYKKKENEFIDNEKKKNNQIQKLTEKIVEKQIQYNKLEKKYLSMKDESENLLFENLEKIEIIKKMQNETASLKEELKSLKSEFQ